MARFEPVTRKMVAEEAGVSVTIVSYVINGNRYVDKDKREKVNKAIKKLDYHPNVMARSLKSKRSHHILFIADQIDNEQFGRLMLEMDDLFYSSGYLVSLAHNRNNDKFIRHIISRKFDGVIISSISMRESYIHALCNAGIAVVLMMNRSYSHSLDRVGRIYTGLYDGARMCVRHLYEQGCRQMLYVDRMSKRGNFSDLSDLRLKGYVDELGALGLPFRTNYVITGCENEEDVSAKIAAHIKKEPTDAIFARNDRMAAIAMHAVKEMGLCIPKDIAVTGFDNSNLSRHITPPLTTIEIDRKGVAGAAADLLQDMLNDKKVSPITLQTRLVVRKSTLKEG